MQRHRNEANGLLYMHSGIARKFEFAAVDFA